MSYKQLDAITVIDYLRGLAPFTSRVTEQTRAREVGDGNLNYVYIVGPLAAGDSIVVKQAVPYLRCVGPEFALAKERMLYESKSLQLFHSLIPAHVPDIFHIDDEMSLMVMQYLGDHIIMRKGLIVATRYPNFVDHITTFMAEALFKTSALYLTGKAKRQLMRDYISNDELCKITEDFVFTTPYMLHETNPANPLLVDEVHELQNDDEFKLAVLELKNKFMNQSDALLHGDLHTGSIMINQHETFVIDSEFAFFGPIGFDVGAVIANLILAWVSHFKRSQDEAYQQWLLDTIESVFTEFKKKFLALWTSHQAESGLIVQNFLSTTALVRYQELFFKQVLQDTIGFAGFKMARRIVGIEGVADIRDIQDPAGRAFTEKMALAIAKRLVLEREAIISIKGLLGILADVRQLHYEDETQRYGLVGCRF